MTIQSKTLAQLVSDAATAIQGAATSLVDMSVGAVLRAFVQAVGAIVMWLQGIALQIAARARLATSSGTDVDSFVGDFGFARKPAVAASDPVQFSRFTATTLAIVPVGTIVQTSDGSVTYAVIADTEQAAYSAPDNGYLLQIGTTSANATVVCQTAGSGGNAAAGAINTIGSTIPGIDSVTNPAAFSNGLDAELDASVKTSFVAWLNTLSKATPASVGSTTEGIQVGVDYTLTENKNYDGSSNHGYFYVVVDDGSGAPSSDFLSAVSNAIDGVRALNSSFGVFPPVVVTANVAMTITVAAGYQKSAVVAAVNAALTNYINTLGLGGPLYWTQLPRVAYEASPGVQNVSAVTINGGTADLAATAQQVIKAGTIAAASA